MRDPADDFAEDLHALAELAEAFLALVSALSEQGATSITAEQVAALAGSCMPHAEAAALGVPTDRRVETVASTGELIAVVDGVRAATGEGPSLDAIEQSDVIVTGELLTDVRWPVFGPCVHAEAGVASIATYRLYLGGGNRGALTFYSTWPHPFDELAIAVGAMFAAYASLVLSHRLNPDSVIPAGRAQSVHTEIGVAVGILLASTGLSTEAGYRRLHAAARRLQLTLPDAARYITAQRTASPEMSARQVRPQESLDRPLRGTEFGGSS